MKHLFLIIGMLFLLLFSTESFAQLPVKPLASQNELLKSDNLTLAQNKKLVYDMWREFLEGGHLELAEKYFLNLLEEGPTKHDLMNMGHVQWSLGNRKAALDYYKQSISQTGFSEAEFMDVFEEDLPQLFQQGIDKDDVPIMLDQLRYFVEE